MLAAFNQQSCATCNDTMRSFRPHTDGVRPGCGLAFTFYLSLRRSESANSPEFRIRFPSVLFIPPQQCFPWHTGVMRQASQVTAAYSALNASISGTCGRPG